MSIWTTLNRSVFKRTSTYAIAIAASSFFFERTFDLICVGIYERVNKGKLWKDIEHNYIKEE